MLKQKVSFIIRETFVDVLKSQANCRFRGHSRACLSLEARAKLHSGGGGVEAEVGAEAAKLATRFGLARSCASSDMT